MSGSDSVHGASHYTILGDGFSEAGRSLRENTEDRPDWDTRMFLFSRALKDAFDSGRRVERARCKAMLGAVLE